MRLGLEEIDPRIAEELLERLATPLPKFLKENIRWNASNPFSFNLEFKDGYMKFKRKRDPSAAERRAFELRRKRENLIAGRAVGTALLTAFTVSGTVTAVQAVHMGEMSSILSVVGATLAVVMPGAWWMNRATPRSRLKRQIHVEEMQAVFPLLRLSRAERIYCDALLMLGQTEVDAETEKSLRQALDQLNRLVLADRQLEQKRQSLMSLLGNNVVSELEAEFGALGHRLDRTSDPVIRQSLDQSLSMCQARLENAKALQQGLERLKAQQEAILHTLSSAQSAMARLQLTPQLHTEVASEEIAEAVSQLNLQTYAVEQAIQEVISLRSQ